MEPKRHDGTAYLQITLGVAICAYTWISFALRWRHSHYVGLVLFTVIGAGLILNVFLRKSSKHIWVQHAYRDYLDKDQSEAGVAAKAKGAFVLGWVLILCAGAWLYVAMNYLKVEWLLTIGMAAAIAIAGWILIGYRSVVAARQQFRAIRKARRDSQNGQ